MKQSNKRKATLRPRPIQKVRAQPDRRRQPRSKQQTREGQPDHQPEGHQVHPQRREGGPGRLGGRDVIRRPKNTERNKRGREGLGGREAGRLGGREGFGGREDVISF